jgi:hypothetical protein
MRKATALPVAALAALSLATGALNAQACPPDEITEWRPRGFRGARPTAAAERTSIESTLSAAEAIARKTAYGRPRGFTVTPTWQYGDASEGVRLRTFQFWSIISHHCNRYDESGADIVLVFNPHPQFWSEGDGPTLLDENGDGLYTERLRAAALFGATATFGSSEGEVSKRVLALFTTGGESPTLPVTREEYLRAIILDLEPKGPTPYAKWMSEAPARKKARDETVAVVAASNPTQAEQLRKDLEKAERDNTELLRQGQAEAGPNRRSVVDGYRAEIAAMTPAERASPAWVRGPDLVPAGSPNAAAIVRVNPAFYRARRSPAEVRAILVHLQNVPVEREAQRQQMVRDLDWAALKRLLNR